MRTLRTHYVVLGIAREATTEAIRAAYRRLAKSLHPDVAGAASTAAFQEVNEAYEVLGDPERRRSYDAELRTFEAHIVHERAARDWRMVPVEPLVPPTPAGSPDFELFECLLSEWLRAQKRRGRQ